MTDQILTEEELKELYFNANERNRSGLITGRTLDDMFKVIKSHHSLLSANAELSNTVVKQNSANLKLVYENDELMAEVNSKKLALEAIGMIVTGEILSNNIDKHLYTVLGIVKHESEELNHE